MYEDYGSKRQFKFESPGDSVMGRVIGDREVQETEFGTRKPKVFPDGGPVMQLVLDLETNLREDDGDDGERRLYLGNRARKAFRRAFKRAKVRLPFNDAGAFTELGIHARVTFTHQDPAAKGKQGAKHFEVALWGGPINAKVVASDEGEDEPGNEPAPRQRTQGAASSQGTGKRQQEHPRQQAEPPPDDIPPADPDDLPF